MADVAAAAGVSKATVSKALNGRDDVAPSTRQLILAAAAELGYRPMTSPSQEGRRAVSVVFDIPASPYILKVLQGVLVGATDGRLDLLTRLPPDRAARADRAIAREWIAEQRASGSVGVIGLTLSYPDALLDAAAEADMPFVIVDPVDTAHRRMVSVASSNWAGARAATDYLIELGHRRIAWIGGPEASDAARDRLYGYRAALDAAGIPADPTLIVSDQFDAAAGARHGHALLSLPERPTAIMAADDEIAIGVLSAARGVGLRVPEDVSVTGFDDTPQAPWTTPPLSTVHQHLDEMGRLAVQIVVAMSRGEPPASRHVELATSLTIRETTAAPS